MPDALVSRLCRWAQMPGEALSALGGLPSRRIEIERGGDPFAMFDSTSSALFMREGWAAQYKDASSGKRVIVELMLPGDLQLPTIHHDRTIGTTMLSAGVALVVPRSAIDMLSQFPAISEALEWTEKVRESIRREWLVNLASRKALPRLAHFFCELTIRMNNVDQLYHDSCEMPLTQIDLANALSMTNVHLNLALQKLRGAKLVELTAKRLRILDRARLEAVAGFSDGYLLRWPTRLPDRRNHLAATLPLEERRSPTSHNS